MEHQSNKYQLVYKMETNQYFKVHKVSGVEVKVNRDGSPIRKFDPSLTGQELSASRFKNRNVRNTLPASSSNKQYQTQNTRAPSHHYQTIQSSAVSKAALNTVTRHRTNTDDAASFVVRKKQAQSTAAPYGGASQPVRVKGSLLEDYAMGILKSMTINYDAGPSQLVQKLVKQRDFFSRLADLEDSTAKNVASVDTLSQTLKRFTQLSKDKLYQNHSLKAGKVPGSNPPISPERLTLATKSYFDHARDLPELKFKVAQPSRKQSPSHLQRLPENLSQKFQYKRQLQNFIRSKQFFDISLIFVDNRNPRATEREFDEHRAKNLKRLEQQFISANQKATSKVYERK